VAAAGGDAAGDASCEKANEAHGDVRSVGDALPRGAAAAAAAAPPLLLLLLQLLPPPAPSRDCERREMLQR
jgi:hypothetical protein